MPAWALDHTRDRHDEARRTRHRADGRREPPHRSGHSGKAGIVGREDQSGAERPISRPWGGGYGTRRNEHQMRIRGPS
jgi:hypothetical protein